MTTYMEPLVERDRVDKLGDYFVYFDIFNRYGITFENFVKKVDNGEWSTIIQSRRYERGNYIRTSMVN